MISSAFIATPISAFESEVELQQFKSWLVDLITAVKARLPDLAVECELLEIQSSYDYDDPSTSVVKDLEAIDRMECFIFVYPKPSASSALIELGYALAKDKPVLVLAKSRNDLPSIVRSRYDEGEGVRMFPLGTVEDVANGVEQFLSECN